MTGSDDGYLGWLLGSINIHSDQAARTTEINSGLIDFGTLQSDTFLVSTFMIFLSVAV